MTHVLYLDNVPLYNRIGDVLWQIELVSSNFMRNLKFFFASRIIDPCQIWIVKFFINISIGSSDDGTQVVKKEKKVDDKNPLRQSVSK